MTLIAKKQSRNRSPIDSSHDTLEKPFLGGIAELIVHSLFFKSEIFLRHKPMADRKVDFLAKGRNHYDGTTNWWNLEVKTTPEPWIPIGWALEKRELKRHNSKIIHINRTAAPFIRVYTFPYVPDEQHRLQFTQALSDDVDFLFDKAVYEYYEQRARLLIVLARMMGNDALTADLYRLAEGVKENPPVYNTSSA